MTHPNPSTALARVITDELARGGVSLFVVAPGSRSAALAIAAAGREDVATIVALDERSAAFHALGRAKALGWASAVISTSGTAAANLFPAVVEADMSHTPLVVLTADRPGELRGVGANQTIDQIELFGEHVRHFRHVEAPDGETDLNEEWRAAVAMAMGEAHGSTGRPGPVHLNVSFREPTVPVTDDGRSAGVAYPFSTDRKPGGAAWVEYKKPSPPAVDIDYSSRGLVVAGDGSYDGSGLLEVARTLRWPVVATATSGLRGQDVVSSYHHLFAAGVPQHLVPDVVVAVGGIGPSDRLEDLVASASTRIRIDNWGRHIDPRGNATEMIMGDPVQALSAIGALDDRKAAWMQSWLEADVVVREALDEELDGQAHLSGGAVARTLNECSWDTLVVGSSLPIREIDAHLLKRGRVIANRGASGIDGLVSTAMGASCAGGTVALIGDLALLHDANGFLVDGTHDVVFVVLDNNGGGLFDSLPQAKHAPEYDRLFVTPQGRDLDVLARFHRVGFVEVDGLDQLMSTVEDLLDYGGLHVIRVPIQRSEDLRSRHRLDEAGRTAVSSLQP